MTNDFTLLTETFVEVTAHLFGMVNSVVSKVMSHPILLLFTLVPLVGIGIGFFKRLLNVN